MSFKGIRKSQKSKSNVSEHIKHIFEEEEPAKEATVRKFRIVQLEGSRCVEREVEHYNLDMIIALGLTLFLHGISHHSAGKDKRQQKTCANFPLLCLELNYFCYICNVVKTI